MLLLVPFVADLFLLFVTVVLASGAIYFLMRHCVTGSKRVELVEQAC